MATALATASTETATPSLAYAVAVWLGMSPAEILRGLSDGSIAPPPGAPPGWTPDSNGDQAPAAPPDGAPIGRDPQHLPPPPPESPPHAPSQTTVEAWLRAIEPEIRDDQLADLWTAGGSDDTARGSWWRDYLKRMLGVGTDKSSASSIDAAIAAAVGDPSHRATVQSLAGKSGAEIAALAKTDGGARYALEHLDPVAITGNRGWIAAIDPDGQSDRFDPNNGERLMSDAYVDDRAKMLAWKLRRDAGGDLAVSGDQRWTFVDRARVGADGGPLSFTVQGVDAGADAVAHQVVFGAAADDSIVGGAADDRLYGRGGNDLIRGGAGADYIEGGQGLDTLAGGRGDDALDGGAGDDDLDGGSGRDAVDGGAGNDTLTGGRGDDTLLGGDGNDTYAFESGDGHDVIIDSDGQGRITFDDTDVAGIDMKRGDDGTWRSADGAFEMDVAAGADGNGTLTVRAVADGANGADSIVVRGWHNGDLGITLADHSNDGLANVGTTQASVDTGEASGDSNSTGSNVSNPATDPSDGAPHDVPAVTSTISNGDFSFVDGLEATGTRAFVMPESINDALRSFAGTSETPDVTAAVHPLDVHSVGITSQHIASAMLDFHDSSDTAIDVGSEPHPAIGASVLIPDALTMPSTASSSRDGSQLIGGHGGAQRPR